MPSLKTRLDFEIAQLDQGVDANQPLDTTLTSLAALNSTAGLIEQTGADAFTKRAIGVSASTSIPTRADADARYGRTIIKSADQSRSSTTTFAADSELTVALDPGSYVIRMVLIFNVANTAMNWKSDTEFTGTATVDWSLRSQMSAGAAISTANESRVVTNALPIASSTAGTSGLARADLECNLVVTVAGTFNIRWAQNTSDAANLTLKRGSYLEYARA